jgi:hypothetical protein
MWWFLLGLLIGEVGALFTIALFSINKESEDNENGDEE